MSEMKEREGDGGHDGGATQRIAHVSLLYTVGRPARIPDRLRAERPAPSVDARRPPVSPVSSFYFKLASQHFLQKLQI